MAHTVYDKVKWHSHANNAPKNLPYEYGATHIAFFFRWCYENNFLSKEIMTDIETELSKNNSIDFRSFLINHIDGVFTSEEMNAKGKKFGNAYYGSDKTKFAKAYNFYQGDYSNFIKQYFGEKHEDNSYYYYEYNEENYETVKKIIEERHQQFIKFTENKSK